MHFRGAVLDLLKDALLVGQVAKLTCKNQDATGVEGAKFLELIDKKLKVLIGQASSKKYVQERIW